MEALEDQEDQADPKSAAEVTTQIYKDLMGSDGPEPGTKEETHIVKPYVVLLIFFATILVTGLLVYFLCAAIHNHTINLPSFLTKKANPTPASTSTPAPTQPVAPAVPTSAPVPKVTTQPKANSTKKTTTTPKSTSSKPSNTPTHTVTPAPAPTPTTITPTPPPPIPTPTTDQEDVVAPPPPPAD